MKLWLRCLSVSYTSLRFRFLGHLVSIYGVETNPEKIKAVAEWPQPENIRQMQRFLDFCNVKI